MSWQRFAALFHARNLEFIRDRSALSWSILLPVLLVLGFAFLFSNPDQDLYKVGVYGADGDPAGVQHPAEAGFLATKHIQFIPVTDLDAAIEKVKHHQLDMLLDMSGSQRYWLNSTSAQGYVLERVLWGTKATIPATGFEKQTVSGREVRYVDWVIPGILAMNMMFGCLFGVGYVIVRYRKNGVLRRLRATPISAFEFLSAQVLSRLTVVTAATLVVYAGTNLLLDFPMRGSYAALVSIFFAGAICMISLGLLVASRIRSEELADGVLNLISWPMMIASGVWFSMEGTHPLAQLGSRLFPLTHVVGGARRIMLDGAGIAGVSSEIALLCGLALLFLTLAARLFRWQ